MIFKGVEGSKNIDVSMPRLPYCCGRANWKYGVWSMEYGVWSMEYGVWSMEYGVWSMEYGVWKITIPNNIYSIF